ncbi:MAG: tRNA (guanosine(37)-N1)-methyltransferase TrmD [Thermodesulfovibrionales bacterium]|nr:tRNA (guanosine(37)-N1)-methyltransferase TrmD [Thermodesulfovibrionales bacterium]
MKFDIITIFPEIFYAYLDTGILKRALQKKLIEVRVHNLRDYAKDRHRTVDDYPYGGGAGMVMKPEPFFAAVETLCPKRTERRVIMLSPVGKKFDQKMAEELSGEKRRLLFLCGRYEAIDERVRIALADDEISIGDYILTGGELAALVIIDAVARLIPGVLGDERSAEEDSFSSGILDYPHYTRPPVFRDMAVPEVLLSGNHREIWRWRRKEALRRTLKRRPGLLEKIRLSDEDYKLISELRRKLQ